MKPQLLRPSNNASLTRYEFWIPAGLALQIDFVQQQRQAFRLTGPAVDASRRTAFCIGTVRRTIISTGALQHRGAVASKKRPFSLLVSSLPPCVHASGKTQGVFLCAVTGRPCSSPGRKAVSVPQPRAQRLATSRGDSLACPAAWTSAGKARRTEASMPAASSPSIASNCAWSPWSMK